MQKTKYVLFTICVVLQLSVSAQTESLKDIFPPLSKEQRLDSLIMLHKELNAINSSIPGYRIQIYFESGNYSKSKAVEVKKAFESDYLGYSAYISFNEPYYRVRVGDFRTKIEAVGFLKKILRKYPNAFEVKDMISFGNFESVTKF
ncbi:MAG: SPOR domain-containing protein [Bacteroidales bacterium]|nr:SPOR domain-containing protein [Bacteroidales bacterium]